MVIVATESSTDKSKAAAVYVHSLLGIQPFARSFEMKKLLLQLLDLTMLRARRPTQSKFWLSLIDIARWVGSSGESAQGAELPCILVDWRSTYFGAADDSVA